MSRMTGLVGFLLGVALFGQAALALAQISMPRPMPGGVALPAGPVGGPSLTLPAGPRTPSLGPQLSTPSLGQSLPASAPLPAAAAPAANVGSSPWSGQAGQGGSSASRESTPAATTSVPVELRSPWSGLESGQTMKPAVKTPRKIGAGGGSGGGDGGDGGDDDKKDGKSWLKKIPWWVWALLVLLAFAILGRGK